MITISIIGTINYDRIILPDGASHQGLGGILYNLLMLAPFIDESARIYPIARVGAERQRQVEGYAVPYPCIDLEGIVWDSAGTNETVLTYRTADERDEALVERVAPLTWDEIKEGAGSDWTVVNMISGKELSLDLMQRFAAESAGRIALDIQSLTLTFQKGSQRNYQPIPRWREWFAGVETVKGNEAEMRAMVGDKGEPFQGTLRELAKICLDAGPAVVIITRGTAGHAAAWRSESEETYLETPAIPLPADTVLDTTGCGDAFTSGYLLGRLRGEDPFAASFLGAALAAASCATRGLEQLATLEDPAALRGQHYGADGRAAGDAVGGGVPL